MRRAPKVNFTQDGLSGNLCGVWLEADFVAEHEWGIKEIHEAFDIPFEKKEKYPGIDRRTVRQVPPGHAFRFVDWGDKALLFYTASFDFYYAPRWGEPNNEMIDKIEESLKSYRNWSEERGWMREARPSGSTEDGLSGAWDKGGFCICGNSKKAVKNLKAIYEALTQKNAAIFLGGSDIVFGNAGLNIAIISALPQDFKDSMKEADLDYIKLRKAHEDSKIEQRLKKAFKTNKTESKYGQNWGGQGSYSFWMALSPRWKDNEDHSKGLIWWLNPENQQVNNYGWFDEEQLMLWPKGEGPIPMTEEQKRQAM